MQDRGNSRMVWLASAGSQGTQINEAFTLTEGQAIDVTAASLFVETGTASSFVGTVTIASDQGVTSTYPIQFCFTGHSSSHVTFDPPVQLRADDRFFVSSGNAPAFSRVEISLHGYVPGAARENSIMAR